MHVTRMSMAPLEIPFRQAFTHASAVRRSTEAVLVKVEAASGLTGMGEGCPRRYVTGETVESALEFFRRHQDEWRGLITLDDVRSWMTSHAKLIDANPAAWCAVEIGFLDLLAKESALPIERLLGGKILAGRFSTRRCWVRSHGRSSRNNCGTTWRRGSWTTSSR